MSDTFIKLRLYARVANKDLTFSPPLCDSLKEIVRRFSSQKETRQLYLRLKEENEKVLQQLKEQMDLLSTEFQNLRSTGQANRLR